MLFLFPIFILLSFYNLLTSIRNIFLLLLYVAMGNLTNFEWPN